MIREGITVGRDRWACRNCIRTAEVGLGVRSDAGIVTP